MTKICVFGAGAIGGYVGARLAMKGEADVSLVARGAHLAAMMANGLTLKQGGETTVVHPTVTDDPKQLGPQDFIILTLKAHAITGVIDQLMPLIGRDTAILFAQNGIPWWYFHGIGGPLEGTRLESVDPGGVIWDRIGPERALGTVVWQAAEIEAPRPLTLGATLDREAIAACAARTSTLTCSVSSALSSANAGVVFTE